MTNQLIYSTPGTKRDSLWKRLRRAKTSHKFMQVIDEAFYRKLGSLAEQRGVTVQELIRAIIIPDWVAKFEDDQQKRELERRHRRATGRRLRPLRPSTSLVRLPRRKH